MPLGWTALHCTACPGLVCGILGNHGPRHNLLPPTHGADGTSGTTSLRARMERENAEGDGQRRRWKVIGALQASGRASVYLIRTTRKIHSLHC